MGITVKIFFTSLVLCGFLVSVAPQPSAMEGPDVVELDALSNIYTAVTFDHTMHVDMATCATCHHHTTGMQTEDVRCLQCHEASGQADEVACTGCHAGNGGKMKESQAAKLFHTESTGLKRAYHLQCLGCHKEMEAASGCEDCHAKQDSSLKVSQINDQLETNYTR